MQTRPTRTIFLSGFAALAVVATSVLASGGAKTDAAPLSSASTAVQASATSGTSSTLQSPVSTFASTATTATTSASFRSVGAALADATPGER